MLYSRLRLSARVALSFSLLSVCLPTPGQSQASSAPTYVMVIHGCNGDSRLAGTILRSRMTPAMEKAYIDTLTIAPRTGYGIAMPFNTEGMYRAWVTSDGKITIKIYKEN